MDNRHLATRKIGRISSKITLKKQHQDATISRMFTRLKRKELQNALLRSPAEVLLGPRQVGKPRWLSTLRCPMGSTLIWSRRKTATSSTTTSSPAASGWFTPAQSATPWVMALKSCHCTTPCKHWHDFVVKHRPPKALEQPSLRNH